MTHSKARTISARSAITVPCPPPGKPHRYFFRLYALDTKLDLKSGADRRTLDQAIKGHIVGEGELMATFGR